MTSSHNTHSVSGMSAIRTLANEGRKKILADAHTIYNNFDATINATHKTTPNRVAQALAIILKDAITSSPQKNFRVPLGTCKSEIKLAIKILEDDASITEEQLSSAIFQSKSLQDLGITRKRGKLTEGQQITTDKFAVNTTDIKFTVETDNKVKLTNGANIIEDFTIKDFREAKPRVQRAFITELSDRKTPVEKAKPFLTASLKTNSPKTWQTAINELNQITGMTADKAMPILKKGIKARSDKTFDIVMKEMGEITGMTEKQKIEVLSEALKTNNPKRWQKAIDGLSEITTITEITATLVKPILLKGLKARNDETKRWTLGELANLGVSYKKAVQFLTKNHIEYGVWVDAMNTQWTKFKKDDGAEVSWDKFAQAFKDGFVTTP